MKHPFGIGSGDGYAIIMLEIDSITEEEGVDGGAPDSVWTDGHGEEDLIRIAEAADELIPCEDAIVVSIFMTVATKLTHFALDQMFYGCGRCDAWRSNT